MPNNVVIPIERFNKILDVVSVLSLGNVDPEKTQIPVTDEDDLAVLEHTLNQLHAELVALRIRDEQARETMDAQRLAIRMLAAPLVQLFAQLGVQVVQKPVEGDRKDLEIIVKELAGAAPASAAGGGAAT